MAVSMELVVNGLHRVPVRLYTETASERSSERGPYLVVRAFAYVIVEGVGYRLNGNFIARPAQERAPAAPVVRHPGEVPPPQNAYAKVEAQVTRDVEAQKRARRKGNGHTSLASVAGSLSAPNTPAPKGSADDWIARMLK